MRRFLIGVIIISFLSLSYVFQYTKLLEHSYLLNSYNKYLSLLIDRNRQLRYNVAKLEAPARLEDIMLAKDTEVNRPERWYKLELKNEMPAVAPDVITSAGVIVKAERIFLSMFSLKREAVAKE